jgi:hypothetical protein
VGLKFIEMNSRREFMAVSRMRFKGDNNGTYYIDLAKALSLQERKLHRQKMIYTVYGGFFVDSQGNRIDINTAPLTWVTKRAVNRGFAMWRKHQAKTLDESGSSLKNYKYNDFKVYLNSGHGSSPLLPVDAASQSLGSGGNWDYATLISEDPDVGAQPGDPTGFGLQIVGPHVGTNPDWTRVGLVDSWVHSRSPPTQYEPRDFPDTADPLMNLFDDGDAMDERLNNMQDENDEPPYALEAMFGNASTTAGGEHNLQRASVAKPTVGTTPVAPIHGFQALCGLVQIVVGSDSASNSWELVLDVETKGEKF